MDVTRDGTDLRLELAADSALVVLLSGLGEVTVQSDGVRVSRAPDVVRLDAVGPQSGASAAVLGTAQGRIVVSIVSRASAAARVTHATGHAAPEASGPSAVPSAPIRAVRMTAAADLYRTAAF